MPDEFDSPRAPEPVGAYPHARRVGNLLFLSGVGPREPGTKQIPGVELDENGEVASYDIEVQCRSVFQNVRYNRPCRTTVEINSLPTPIAIELKVIATID